jgi:hypothetical protein
MAIVALNRVLVWRWLNVEGADMTGVITMARGLLLLQQVVPHLLVLNGVRKVFAAGLWQTMCQEWLSRRSRQH